MSAFVNEALVAYTTEIERALSKEAPRTNEERTWLRVAAESFVGDDNEDWDALFPVAQ